MVLVNVRTSLNDIIKKHKILVKLDDDARHLRNQLIDDNSGVIMQISEGKRTGYEDIDSVITRMAIRLSLKEDKNSYYLNHIKVEPGKPYDDTNSGEEIIKNKNILEDRNIQRLVAYEVFERYFELIEGREEKFKLEQYESELWKSINRENKTYAALSFLPIPYNQLRSNTKKGLINSGVIIGGYVLSSWSLKRFNDKWQSEKNEFNNISDDEPEADEKRKFHKDNITKYENYQIVCGGMLVVTYLYSVMDALWLSKDNYQKNSKLTITPAAYDNGAGVALVYRF
jgi:hypothetical protein